MNLDIRKEAIWRTRGRNWGFRFLSTSSFTDDEAFVIHDAVFAYCDNVELPYSASGSIIKRGVKECNYFAQKFYDPVRKDASGRQIIHELIIVSQDSVPRFGVSVSDFCAAVKEYYDGIFDVSYEEVSAVGNTICVDFDTVESNEANRKDVVINDNESNDENVSPSHTAWFQVVIAALVVGGAVFWVTRGIRSESSVPSEKGSRCEGRELIQGTTVVARKLQSCDFLLNKDFKKNAKVYCCLFSASWCPPCRKEMPRIVKSYAEKLKDDPDIELIHFSCDRDESKAMNWARECGVQFPVVKPQGGKPLNLHTQGIPHMFIVKSDGTLIKEGHPSELFTEGALLKLEQ